MAFEHQSGLPQRIAAFAVAEADAFDAGILALQGLGHQGHVAAQAHAVVAADDTDAASAHRVVPS